MDQKSSRETLGRSQCSRSKEEQSTLEVVSPGKGQCHRIQNTKGEWWWLGTIQIGKWQVAQGKGQGNVISKKKI